MPVARPGRAHPRLLGYSSVPALPSPPHTHLERPRDVQRVEPALLALDGLVQAVGDGHDADARGRAQLLGRAHQQHAAARGSGSSSGRILRLLLLLLCVRGGSGGVVQPRLLALTGCGRVRLGRSGWRRGCHCRRDVVEQARDGVVESLRLDGHPRAAEDDVGHEDAVLEGRTEGAGGPLAHRLFDLWGGRQAGRRTQGR